MNYVYFFKFGISRVLLQLISFNYEYSQINWQTAAKSMFGRCHSFRIPRKRIKILHVCSFKAFFAIMYYKWRNANIPVETRTKRGAETPRCTQSKLNFCMLAILESFFSLSLISAGVPINKQTTDSCSVGPETPRTPPSKIDFGMSAVLESNFTYLLSVQVY